MVQDKKCKEVENKRATNVNDAEDIKFLINEQDQKQKHIISELGLQCCELFKFQEYLKYKNKYQREYLE